ncbi:redoxin domain-containing protein [candidate division KSB1 bacterium]|nr:redoxin domain-containing protein [candidate division KSB1 bacterium]
MAVTPSTMLPLGTEAPYFRLPDFNDEIHSLADFREKPLLVMFICNHCPYVRHIRSKLAEVVKEYQKKGIAAVAINSNDVANYRDDSPQNMKKVAAQYGFTFPYLFDETQEVAKVYKAACTPDFFLFDEAHRLVYRGQFDNSRPGSNVPVTGEDLSQAVDDMLTDRSISPDQKPSIGCNIKWKAGNEPDYFK